MLEFLKAPFLVLHFSYYALMTFLTILSVILLSMLMILLSKLSVIRHLICGNNLNWLLNLNLIYKTLWTGVKSALLISVLEKLNCLIFETLWTGVRSDFLISTLEELNWLRLTSLITMILLM